MNATNQDGVPVPSEEFIAAVRATLKNSEDGIPFAERAAVLDYTNHRGERGWRLIQPQEFRFTATDFHPVQQWMVLSRDLIKTEQRTFAMEGVHAWLSTELFLEMRGAL